MDTALAQYKNVVQAQPVLEQSWFGATLARCRSGDEEARRQILGSALRLALPLAEHEFARRGAIDLFDLIQEGNVALTTALDRFTGATVEEFVRQAEQEVALHLQKLEA